MSDETLPIKNIPPQLQSESFRFIRLFSPSNGKRAKSGKEPMDKGWNIDKNYTYTDEMLRRHVNRGGNYGVIPRGGGVCILDIDDYDRFQELDKEGIIEFNKLFKDTFSVISGHISENHYHIYFKCPAHNFENKKIVLTDVDKDGRHLGEIYMTGFNGFVVGPNSTHQSGKIYRVVNPNVEIKAVQKSDLDKFINHFAPISNDVKQVQKYIADGEDITQSSITTKLNLRIEELAFPLNPEQIDNGEYQGTHPIHGSSTGHNFNINIYKNVWHCWRCNSGGDPALWLAVEYGIIQCHEARSDLLTDPTIFKQLLDCIKRDPRFSDKLNLLDNQYKTKSTLERLIKLAEQHHKQGTETDESDIDINAVIDGGIEFHPVKPTINETDKIYENILAPPKTTRTDNENIDIFEEMRKRNIFESVDIHNLKFKCNLDKSHIIQQYVNMMSDRTDAYPEYHYAAAYAMLSMVVDRKTIIKMRQGKIYSNLWVFSLGTSTISRKSTSIKKAIEFAGYFNTTRRLPNDFSPESLIEILSQEPKQYFFKDEVGSLLSKLQNSYMSSTRDLFCELYECTDYHRILRSSKGNQNEFHIIDPYLTILFATTYDTFRRYTTFIDMTSGFLYRFLFFTPHYADKKYLPLSPEEDEDIEFENELKSKFRDIYLMFSAVETPIEFRLGPLGLKYFQEWQKLREIQSQSRNYIEQSMLGRLITIALKLAMLFKIGEKNFARQFSKWNYRIPREFAGFIEIDDEYIIEACYQIDTYFFPAAVSMASDVEKDESTNQLIKIESILERAGGTMSKTKLLQTSHLKSKELLECLDAMVNSKTITIKRESQGKGRQTTWITLCRNSDDYDVDDVIMPIIPPTSAYKPAPIPIKNDNKDNDDTKNNNKHVTVSHQKGPVKHNF